MSKVKFWILNLTWGLTMTLIGLIAALCLIVTGHKHKTFNGAIYFVVGRNWGGVSLGSIIIVSKYGDNQQTLTHELGHAVQNARYGCFMPLLVAIPSCVRYWYRRIVVALKIKKSSELKDYYSIWFEKQANELGREQVIYLSLNENSEIY